jgi:uncharacterized flavoprotein (TIGR03862 family)
MSTPSPTDPAHAVVIGGGPAGLMAAEVLAGVGHRVTVLERMPSLGRRLLMAGRGGLNITHTEPMDDFLGRYGPEAGWLAPIIERFGPQAIRDWCAGLGIETFAGSSGRVFPVTMKASPLLRAWVRRLDGLGVVFRLRAEWRGFGDDGILVAGPQGEEVIPAAAVVLACGGATWPRLGADGNWVARLGEAVTPFAPANGGFTVPWSGVFAERFAGTPLKGVAFAVGDVTARGEAVITKKGLEGGGIYAVSRALRAALAAGDPTLVVDLKPDTESARLAKRLSGGRRGLSMANRLRRAGLSPVQAGLLREGFPGGLAREAETLAGQIKAVPIRVTGTTGMARAISSAGGLPLDALDEGLMLRRRPGVFVCGEMLDWEAPTGGYLLTACLATGRAAGHGAAAWLAAGGRLPLAQAAPEVL